MGTYGIFCPIAKAAEVLSERWTVLILTHVLMGSRRFNEVRRAIPKISPTLLSKRLQELHEHGILARKPAPDGNGWEYEPTQAGRDLMPLVEFMGHWGQRWVRSRLTRDELDPGALAWYMHRHFRRDKLPQERIVLHLEFSDVRRMRVWWFVIEEKSVDLCLEDPGHEVDVYMYSDLLTMTKVYIGDISLDEAAANGKIRIDGPRALTRSMTQWFARSKFADSGRESVRSAPLAMREASH